MTDAWIEVQELKRQLHAFFSQRRMEFQKFGSTVNQTFEAFVFAQVVAWYKSQPHAWQVEVRNPIHATTSQPYFRLKFSTRGKPSSYSYVLCKSLNGQRDVQVRHQIRVATRHHKDGPFPKANICLDVAVIENLDLSSYATDDHVSNSSLLSFGEAKHMSAFAELIAGFLGMVHELQPERLKRTRTRNYPLPAHPAPFLFVSGKLWRTAEGMVGTIERRKYDIDVYHRAKSLSHSLHLPTSPPTA